MPPPQGGRSSRARSQRRVDFASWAGSGLCLRALVHDSVCVVVAAGFRWGWVPLRGGSGSHATDENEDPEPAEKNERKSVDEEVPGAESRRRGFDLGFQ